MLNGNRSSKGSGFTNRVTTIIQIELDDGKDRLSFALAEAGVRGRDMQDALQLLLDSDVLSTNIEIGEIGERQALMEFLRYQAF